MRAGLLVLGIAAVAASVVALVMLETRQGEGPLEAPEAAPVRATTPARPVRTSRSPGRTDASQEPAARPPGFKLGKRSGPEARVQAQAILDDALAELRRLGPAHKTLARDVYMRAHSAAERVDDELDDDDEPGSARLRAHEDAMKAELRRIYGVDDATPRP